MAEPGGICVSQIVRDPVRERLGFTFEDIGEQTLKNIAASIRAYRVRFEGPDPAEREPVRPARSWYRLNPHYPPWYNNASDPYYATGQYEKVITMTRRTMGDVPVWGQMVLTFSYAQLRRQADVAVAKAEFLRRYPDFSLERFLSDFGSIPDETMLAHYMDGRVRPA